MFDPIQIPKSNEYYKMHEAYRNATYLTSFHAAYHFPKDLRAAVKTFSPSDILVSSAKSKSKILPQLRFEWVEWRPPGFRVSRAGLHGVANP